MHNMLMKQGGNSQNFLGKFVRFFITLGLKILRLLRLKLVFFKADIIFVTTLFLELGGNSQNFLHKFVRFFVTLGLKILRLLRLIVVF